MAKEEQMNRTPNSESIRKQSARRPTPEACASRQLNVEVPAGAVTLIGTALLEELAVMVGAAWANVVSAPPPASAVAARVAFI